MFYYSVLSFFLSAETTTDVRPSWMICCHRLATKDRLRRTTDTVGNLAVSISCINNHVQFACRLLSTASFALASSRSPTPQTDVELQLWVSEVVLKIAVSTLTSAWVILRLSRVLAADLASVSALYPSDTSPNCFSPVHWVLFPHQHRSNSPTHRHRRVRNSALITCCRAITIRQSRRVSLTIHSNITLPWRRLPGAAPVYRAAIPLMFVVYAMAAGRPYVRAAL